VNTTNNTDWTHDHLILLLILLNVAKPNLNVWAPRCRGFLSQHPCKTNLRTCSVYSTNLSLGGHEGLLLLLELEGDEGEPLGGDVELGLELPGLVDELEDLLLRLLRPELGGLACLLAGVTPAPNSS